MQELEKKANEAKQAYEEANTTATQKAQEAKNKKNDLDNAGNNLNSAEKDLENNPDVKKLSDAEKAVEAAKKAADAAAKKDTSKTTANFAGFLDYVIETYKNSTSKEDKALLEDAQRAKQILNGKRVEIMKQVQNKGKTENVLDRVIEVPMWYKDLVKLGKVGGADSLQNMKEAATYYDSLNKLRKEDSDKNSANTEEKKALGDVNVRLSLIAESIVNSFYSGANHDHAINHPGYEGSEVMETTPYKTAENLAWGNYDGDSTNHKDQEYSKCYVTVNGNTSCSTKYGEKYNALSGWYTVEKERYDKAVAGTFVTGEKNNEKHKISDAGKEMLKQHRYDLRQYMWQHPEIKLFVDDADNSKLKDIFLESVGHYTNFASKDITAGGFAESDLSLEEVTTRIVGSTTTTKEDVAGDVAVWHGSNESSISVAEYKKLLSNYENSLKQEKAAGSASENTDEIAKLQKLNAEANKANYDLFVKKYELRKLHYDLNMSDANNLDAADAAKPEVGLQDQEKNALDVLKKKAQELVAYYSQTGVEWSAPQEIVNLLLNQAKSELQRIDSKITNITNSISTADSKKSEIERLKKAVASANTTFEQSKTASQEANKAKEEAAKKATELKTAWTTAQQKYQEAEQAASQASKESKEKRDQQIQKLQGELQSLQTAATGLNAKATKAKKDADAARTAANEKQAEVNVKFTQAVTAAEANVESAKQAVATAETAKKQADTELQKANDKVTNLKQMIQTLEAQITAESKKVDEAKSEVQAARAALDGAKDTQNTVTTQLKALQTKAQNADETVKNTKSAVEVAKKAVVEKIKLAQTAVANAQAKVKTAQEVVEAAKTKIETIQKNLEAAETKFKAVVTDQTTQQSFMQSTFLAAYQSFESFVQTLTEKVNTLKTTAATLTESAKTLATQLPESVVTPSVVPPVVPPAPKPPVVVPSHGESGHGNTGNTENTTNTGNTENAGNTGNNNVPFIPQTPHVSVPAVDVEQQSNEFASTTAENHATQAVVKSETGKSTKAEHANEKASVKNTKANTQHTRSTSSATSTSANQNNAQSHDANKSAENKNAENKKNSESKQEDNKQETQDSNNNNSTQNEESQNRESQKEESKNSQASGNSNEAQQEGNKTLAIAAIVASAIAGIAAIGGGITFARHRRM